MAARLRARFCYVSPLLAAVTLVAGSSAREEGIAAFRDGRYSVALTKLQAAAKDPQDRTAHAFLGMTQAALGHCQAALPELTQSPGPEDAAVSRLAGLAAVKCYSMLGDEGRTFSLLQRLEQRFPNDADVLYTAAKLHMKAFNEATFAMFQHTPASYRVHELSAEIFEVQNRYGDAVAEYRKAIELKPNAPDLHYRLGRALLLQSHDPASLQQAAAEFRSELKVNPEDGGCEFQLGQIAQVEGKSADAKAHFERAVQLSPDYVQALIALGKMKAQEKQYGSAIELLSRATKQQPANEAAHYALMTAYRDAGRMDEAKQEKTTLDRLQKPPEGEFSDFLKKLGAQQPQQ